MAPGAISRHVKILAYFGPNSYRIRAPGVVPGPQMQIHRRIWVSYTTVFNRFAVDFVFDLHWKLCTAWSTHTSAYMGIVLNAMPLQIVHFK